jgi:hypothetical protein
MFMLARSGNRDGQHPFILVQDATHVGLQAEPLLAPPSPLDPVLPPRRLVVDQAGEGTGQRPGAPRGDEQARPLVYDHLGDPPDSGADDREAVRHGLQGRVAQRLDVGGHDRDVRGGQPRADVLLETDEAGGAAELLRQVLHSGTIGAPALEVVADDQQLGGRPPVARQQHPGPDQLGDPLALDDLAGERGDDPIRRQAESGAGPLPRLPVRQWRQG